MRGHLGAGLVDSYVFRPVSRAAPGRLDQDSWQLTKGAALDRESEKAGPNLRWRSITASCVQGTSHLERVQFLHILAILRRSGLAGVNRKAESFRSG